MATTSDVRITKAGGEGDLYYRAANGVLIPLAIPGDWATTNYVLAIVAGIPAWREAGSDAVFAGLYPSAELFPGSDIYPEGV